MFARIFQPSKTTMQSGKGKAKNWVIEFEQEVARRIDPLMGWTSGSDMTTNQVHLKFDTKEAAITYAKEHGLAYRVVDTPEAEPVIKAYSDNFATNRRKPWTH